MGAEGTVDRVPERFPSAVPVPGVGQERVYFQLPIPEKEDGYQLRAEISDDSGRATRSLRDFRVVNVA